MTLFMFSFVFLAGGLILEICSRQARKKFGAIESLETTFISDLAPGTQVEIKGIASTYTVLKTPMANTDCLYYRYSLEEKYPTKDSRGRTSYRWREIDSGCSRARFMISDDSGTVTIDPAGADTDIPVLFEGPYRENDLPEDFFGKLAAAFDNPRRITVRGIGEGQALYVQGFTHAGSNGMLIQAGEAPFIISTRSEEEQLSSLARQAFWMGLFGKLMIAGGLVLAGWGILGQAG